MTPFHVTTLHIAKINRYIYLDTYFQLSTIPDCMYCHRDRMGFPIPVNDGKMDGLAAIALVPIGAKQEV